LEKRKKITSARRAVNQKRREKESLGGGGRPRTKNSGENIGTCSVSSWTGLSRGNSEHIGEGQQELFILQPIKGGKKGIHEKGGQ